MKGNTTRSHNGKATALAHLGALLCISVWGISFVSTKVLLNNGMQPVEIYIYRFTLAYLIILFIGHKQWFCHNWRDEGLMALCGLLAGSIYFLAENFGLQYTLVSNVSLLTSTSPLITAMLVGLLYKSDRPGKGMIIGSLVAFTGVGCVIFNSSFSLEINPLGDMLSILAAFSWAFYSLILKKLNATYDVWMITRKTFFYGVVTALPFLLIEPPTYSPAAIVNNGAVLGNLLFLGLGASLLAYILWAETVKSLGAVKANNYMYLQPVITLIFSVIFLHETVSIVGITGCVLILGGLWLGDYLTRRMKMRQ